MTLLQILLTALLSSAATLVVVAVYYRKVLEPRLRAQLDEVAAGLGEDIEQRVRRGVLAALSDAASGEPLIEATRILRRRTAHHRAGRVRTQSPLVCGVGARKRNQGDSGLSTAGTNKAGGF